MWRWLKSTEAKTAAAKARAKVPEQFKKLYPHADMSRFDIQVNFDEQQHQANAEVFFEKGDGFLQSTFGSDKMYWSPVLKKALGPENKSTDDGFPDQLLPSSKSELPIPAVEFSERAPSISNLSKGAVIIYATTPTEYFVVEFQQNFEKGRITHHSGKE